VGWILKKSERMIGKQVLFGEAPVFYAFNVGFTTRNT